jgi:gamma-glutamyl:cysteine ligase YbdK (ATP-grasp superfamily)
MDAAVRAHAVDAGPGRANAPLRAVAGYGIELEYAIVARDTLDVRPLAPALLAALAGGPASDAVCGPLGWSNELVAHVVELKNAAPVATLAGLGGLMQRAIGDVNATLAGQGACLLPGGMHPWMNPGRETVLWPHAGAPIYAAYHRIFDCHRHGWANLQSMHVNLPFADDAELVRLHAAVRMVLPLIPALAASAPYVEGRRAPALDPRGAGYASNSACIPPITGAVIPEDIGGAADYHARILAPMYAAIAPHDPEGVLSHEWLNARGAIVRFDRNAIEIRLCDAQECPHADLAIAAAVTAAARAVYEERWCSIEDARATPTAALAAILASCTRDAERASIDDPAYLALLGLAAPQSAGAVWAHLVDATREALLAVGPDAAAPLDLILRRGTLARRLVRFVGEASGRARLHEACERLRDCLARGVLFDA